MKKNRLAILRIVLTAATVAVIAFIFSQSMMNADASADESGSLLERITAWLRSIGIGAEISEHFLRKTAHFAEYFVLGTMLSLTGYSYVRRRGRMLLLALPAALLVAVCDELIQLTSAGRSCEVGDMMLDFSAAAIAGLLVTLILYLVSRRKQKTVKKEMDNHE